MMAWPKPVQTPHPPVIVGGAFPYGARRAIAYGDGWVPHRLPPAIRRRRPVPAEFFKHGAGGRARSRRHRRSRCSAVPPDVDLLRHYRDIGIARVVVSLDFAAPEAIRPRLDAWAEVMRRVAAG